MQANFSLDTATLGQCFCGTVKLRVFEPLAAPINCHCGQCRRLNGAAFTTWFSVPERHLEISGEASLSEFSPTENLTRKFCKFCGAHVVTQDKRSPKIVGIHAGTFDSEKLPKPKADYFVTDKAAWFDIPPGTKCFGGKTGFESIEI